jgi:hypothetical protein
VRGRRGTKEHADPHRLRESLLEDLQRLGGEVGLQHRQPRDVAAGARQARHVPEADGVGMGGENDWDVLVTSRAASVSVEEVAKIRSTFTRTNPAACSRSCSIRSAHRNSMTMVLPSI